MFKHAFLSYILSLHPRRRRKTKEEPKSFFISFICMWVIIWRMSEQGILWLITRIIPILFIRWSNLEIGSYMGKVMLLCPIKQEKRKEYINYMLGFKIGCPVILGFLLEMLWSMCYGFDLKRIVLLFISYISYAIAETIHIDCIDKTDNRILEGKKDRKGNVKWAWENFSVSLVALFLIAEHVLVELDGIQGQFYMIQSLVGSIYLIIMDIVILCTQYKHMIEETVDYELAFYVPGRLHYIKNE